MGLDDLLDEIKEKKQEEEPEKDTKKTQVGNTEPANSMLDDTMECPMCGTVGELQDEAYKCEFSWCKVDFFVDDNLMFYSSNDDPLVDVE